MGGGSRRKKNCRGENRGVANDKISLCDKVDEIPKVDEITDLRELNQQLNNVITSLQQEKASLCCDKTNLEATVLHLKNEKIELESELMESKARTTDLLEKIENCTQLWDSERRKWEASVADLQTRLDLMVSERELLSLKNKELCTGEETLNAQLNVLKFELNESKGRTGELQGKIEDDQRLWNKEKRNMENSLAELQTNLELMASERGSLSQKNIELGTEVECLKIQLNEYNDTLVRMEDERQVLKAMSTSDSERLEALLTKNAAMEDKIKQLQQNVNEGVKQHSDSIQQYKETEHALKQQMKESASKGEQQKADLRSQLLATAKEKDSQFFVTQSVAMEDEKRNQLADLEDQFPSLAWAKDLLEEENTSLQISEKGQIRELETKKAERHLVDLQYQLSDLAEKINSIVIGVKSKLKHPLQLKSPAIQNGKQKSVDENGKPEKINSIVIGVKSKLKHPLQLKSPAIQNGKQKSVDENGKRRGLHERPKPNGVHENHGKANRVMETPTPKQLIEKPRQARSVPWSKCEREMEKKIAWSKCEHERNQ